MELTRFQVAAAKRTAMNTKKLVARKVKLEGQIKLLAMEVVELNKQIDAWEEPIKIMSGGYTSEEVIRYNGHMPDVTTEPEGEVQESNNE